MRTLRFLTIVVMAVVGSLSLVAAESPSAFYQGKTVKLLVGTTTGGGYDLYARMIAPALEKRLGARVIIENRPGGSHMVAMNAVYSAPPDGLTTILASAEGSVLAKLLGEPGIRFDLKAFPIIARVNTAPRILLVNPRLPYRTVRDIHTSGREITLGFAGTTDGGSDTGMIMCHALQLKCRAIIGYPSSKEFSLAAVKGEVDGTVLTDDSSVRFAENGDLRMIAVIGRQKSELAPQVPTVFEAADISPENAWWLDLRDDVRKLGRIIMTTPGVPEDRVAYLQQVAMEVLTDHANMKEFAARNMPVQYAGADEMSAIIQRMLGDEISEQRVRELRRIILEKFYR